MEILAILLLLLIISSIVQTISSREALDVNKEILSLLQEMIDKYNIEEDIPEQPNAELIALNKDEEENEEDELPKSLRDKMSSSTSLWEEDGLDAEEIERI